MRAAVFAVSRLVEWSRRAWRDPLFAPWHDLLWATRAPRTPHVCRRPRARCERTHARRVDRQPFGV